MDKAIIYSHINLLRLRINEILIDYPFKELICNEIINASIIAIGEIDKSSFDDKETAKGMVRMQIENFFKPQNISLVVDKYWNERLIYGFSRVNPTKDNLIRFRSAVDTSKPSVLEIKYSMLNAVQNAELPISQYNSKHSTKEQIVNVDDCRNCQCVYCNLLSIIPFCPE